MKKTLPFMSIIILLLAALTWQQLHMKSLILTNRTLLEKVELYKSQFSQLDHKFNQLNDENMKSNEANANAYSEALQYYQVALTQLNNDLKQQVEIISQNYKKENLLVFNLLDDTGAPYIDHYGILPPEADAEKKLRYIAHYLQTHYFENAVIEIKSLEILNGKKTAVINLSEKEPSSEDEIGWATLYFQGSTGGSMTEMILIEGFLQRQLANWPIDAVEFLYENEQIQFEHVPRLKIEHCRS
ncbi:hypothetical protein [Fusibacter sp. 3D3]|uniref:hypothetical protein n=1 Tax=Fusibacter sp. 3D3 TaxID=1048380 RepID=UPI0008535FB7|nr:hypothetical protein [Fusibacter sp. 3D3]GAU79016.1 hypothetical protein F3D3_3652 [Fusibacter sp. 3D3]